jgi:hypothetical protein
VTSPRLQRIASVFGTAESFLWILKVSTAWSWPCAQGSWDAPSLRLTKKQWATGQIRVRTRRPTRFSTTNFWGSTWQKIFFHHQSDWKLLRAWGKPVEKCWASTVNVESMRQEKHFMILQIHTTTQRTDMQTLLHHRKKTAKCYRTWTSTLLQQSFAQVHPNSATIGIIIGLHRYTSRKER